MNVKSELSRAGRSADRYSKSTVYRTLAKLNYTCKGYVCQNFTGSEAIASVPLVFLEFWNHIEYHARACFKKLLSVGWLFWELCGMILVWNVLLEDVVTSLLFNSGRKMPASTESFEESRWTCKDLCGRNKFIADEVTNHQKRIITYNPSEVPGWFKAKILRLWWCSEPL